MSLLETVAAEAARAALDIIATRIEDLAMQKVVAQRTREMLTDQKLLLRAEAQEMLDARKEHK